ncbi:MAG TPA: hypothetical protein VEB63_03000 [Chitinophagaceae bacterium]|nr:hypothetical protein [Chitinophagaceae bacterium]
MERRSVIVALVLLFLFVLVIACRKDNNGLRVRGVETELDVGSLRPDPMPPDSLLLDTLASPGYQ